MELYQDLDSITQSELMRMMNDNSKDEEIQVGSYLSYIPTECWKNDIVMSSSLFMLITYYSVLTDTNERD